MEHREPPRIFSAEGRNRDPAADVSEPLPRRFPRFSPPPTVRRLKPLGLAWVAVGFLAFLTLSVWIVVLVLRGGTSYVHAQPDHQIAFDALTLKDEPPSWYRGGRTAFLERVRSESRFERSFSILDVDLKRLRLAFQRDAWVLEVGQVRKSPHEVVVPLKYRKPVAIGRFHRVEEQTVDAEGVLLPRDEIELDAAAPLVFLQDFPRPVDPRFGLKWHRLDGHGVPEPDPRVSTAARLAGFLQDKIRREPAQTPHFPRFFIFGDDRTGWVQVGTRDFFRWNDALDSVKPVELSDDEKWSLLIDHVRHCSSPPDRPHYFRFTRQGLESVRFEQKRQGAQ